MAYYNDISHKVILLYTMPHLIWEMYWRMNENLSFEIRVEGVN